MVKFNDGYYDPPEEDETCRICHREPDDCTCPECPGCGEVGDPACINAHLPWDQWGHFNFRPSERELKAEQKFERMQSEMEDSMGKLFEAIPPEEPPVLFDDEEHKIHLPEDEEFLNHVRQLDLEPRCSHPRAGDGVYICPDCGQQLD